MLVYQRSLQLLRKSVGIKTKSIFLNRVEINSIDRKGDNM